MMATPGGAGSRAPLTRILTPVRRIPQALISSAAPIFGARLIRALVTTRKLMMLTDSAQAADSRASATARIAPLEPGRARDLPRFASGSRPSKSTSPSPEDRSRGPAGFRLAILLSESSGPASDVPAQRAGSRSDSGSYSRPRFCYCCQRPPRFFAGLRYSRTPASRRSPLPFAERHRFSRSWLEEVSVCRKCPELAATCAPRPSSPMAVQRPG